MTVFVRYGYRLTGMERVGQEAGVSRQAVYHHFASKEVLFRAVISMLHEGAHEAAAEAGRAAEATGAPLAKVLSAQLMARWRFYADHLENSPHAEELMAEHHRQTQDMKLAYTQRQQKMLEDTIGRDIDKGTRLRDDVTAEDLARLVVLAELGAKNDPRGAAGLSDLETVVDLIIRGATAAPCPTT